MTEKNYFVMDLHTNDEEERHRNVSFQWAKDFLLIYWEGEGTEEERDERIEAINNADFDELDRRLEGIGFTIFDNEDEMDNFIEDWFTE